MILNTFEQGPIFDFAIWRLKIAFGDYFVLKIIRTIE